MKREPLFIRNCIISVCALGILGGTGAVTLIRHFPEIQHEISDTAAHHDDLAKKVTAVIDKSDEVWNSNLAFRKYFSSLDSNMKYYLTGDFDSNQVLLGREDWLFYKTTTDGAPIDDYKGEKQYSEEEMQKMVWNMRHFQQILKKKGMDFVIFIAPNKEEVYSEYLPDTIQKVNEKNRTDLLVEYLREMTDIPVIYPKNELCKAAKTEMLYYKNDTHWNQKGAFIGTQVLLEEVYGKTKKELSDQKFKTIQLEKKDSNYNDLSRMVGMDGKFYDKESYEIIPDKKEKIEESVFLIGDSFGVSFLPCLQQEFEEVTYCHRNSRNMGLLEHTNPDLVILEYVERYTEEMDEFVWDNVRFISIG